MQDVRIDRFHAYAAAFETAYRTDDWTVLEPFFTEDVVSELNGAQTSGRAAVIRAFRDSVAAFDRRFDAREMRLIEGPALADGVVHIKTANTYHRDGLEPLELFGEEWFSFDGDRIVRHADRVLNADRVMDYLGRHLADLRPLAA